MTTLGGFIAAVAAAFGLDKAPVGRVPSLGPPRRARNGNGRRSGAAAARRAKHARRGRLVNRLRHGGRR